MTIPSTEIAIVLLALSGLICWSLWPQLMKATGKYRFELFYYDLSIGLFLSTLAAAFTLGTFGSEITFMDNIAIIRLTQIMYALIAGVVCNLGVLLMMAGAAVAGLGVAGSVTAATSLCMFAALQFYLAPRGNAWVVLAASVLAFICIGLAGRGYQFFLHVKAKDDLHRTPMRKPPDIPGAWKATLLSFIAGLLVGGIVPLFEKARLMELEMGPYAMALVFAAGWLVSAPLLSMYFLNLPVQGRPLSPFTYFKAASSHHVKGIAAGIVMGIGFVTALLAAVAPPQISPGLPVLGPLMSASFALAALGGMQKWKEFEDAPYRSRSMVLAAIGLTAVAAGAVAVGLMMPAV
jgi:glucose uptake protein